MLFRPPPPPPPPPLPVGEKGLIGLRHNKFSALKRGLYVVSLAAMSAALIFAAPAHAQPVPSVCDRTEQVRDRIVELIRDVSDCADVTDDHLSGITGSLHLHSRGIATLKAGDFSGLGNLKQLTLSGNQLSTLPVTVFSGFGSLVELSLSGNQLSDLPAGVFSDLGSLERLWLYDNRLTTLPATVFSGLVSLERLRLYGNRLTILPATVFSGLGNLVELLLNGNQLSTLPATVFSGLGNLESLDLRENPGAPFVFARPRLEPTGTLPRPGVVEVKLVVDETWPTMMTAVLSAEGGELSVEEVVIPGGSSESAVFSVTQTAGAPVTLRAATVVLTGYFGVETAPSELVLDVVGPSVSGVAIVSIPASGDAYQAADSEVIRVEVGFDEAVEVSTTIAGPSLALTIGETTRAATYIPDLSRATTLVFTYALQTGDADADGIGIGEDALVLAGAEIADLFGNPIESTSLGSYAVSNAAGHQVVEHIFRVFFEPAEIRLVRGGAAMVVLKIEPALQGSEEVVVDLGDSRSLTRGLTVNPARATLTLMSNEADITVAAESTADLGKAELSATLDAGASALGNSRVATDSLMVEVSSVEVSFDLDSPISMLTPAEGATATVVVSLSQELSTDVTAAYRIERHEADGYDPAEPADYSTPLGVVTVTIEAGETTAAIMIAIIDDEEIEPTREAFKVVLQHPSAGAFYILGDTSRTSATVVINEGVCDRTPQVRDEILREISGVSDCAEVTDGHLSGVRSLSLQGSGIATLKAGDFSGLDKLERLWLYGNRLTTLPATVFSDLGNLERLRLYDNGLTTLPATVFSGLGNLLELLLHGNQLSDLPVGVFSSLSNLISLRLNGNQLSTLSAGVFSGLGNLERLFLESNQLSALLAGFFSSLGSLQSLNLSNNPGAPFVFAGSRLEPTGTSPRPGVVEVKLVVDETLPTTMTAALSAEGGGLSVEEVEIPEGSSESAVFSVTQIAGAPVTLRASTGVLTDYVGVETAPSELVLDVVGPSVSGVAIVSVPASGDAYQAADGEVIRVAVGFDEAVEVSTTIAGPSLALTIGGTTRAASYVPGLSGATTLVFAYALQTGDADADGIGIGEDALVLAGAGITDLFGNPIENTSLGSHAVSNLAGHQVVERTFRVFFEPAEIRLVRGGAAMVVLKIEPALKGSEEVVVDLGDPRGLTGGLTGGSPAGLTVDPTRATLTSTSNEADITVAAESTAALGKTALSATLDLGASSLGNSRVSTESLTVEVVLPAEAAFEPDSLMVTTTEGKAVTVVVSLYRELFEDVTVAYRIEGHEADGYDPAEPADYSTPLGVVTVTVEAGATTAAIVIDIIDDEEIEPPREAFRVVLQHPPAGAFYILGETSRTSATVVINEGVCDRTPQVRDGIAGLISGVNNCADVTDDDLSGVAGTLDFFRESIVTLKAGDFSGLGNLRQLTLSGNQLSTLPATVFSGLDKLVELRLGDNRLTTLPATVFSGLVNLQVLIFVDNQLSDLPATVFSGLVNLQVLDLSNSQLSDLPAGVFSGLVDLERLFLHNNQLSILPADVFSGLGSLERLDLSSNQLSALPVGVFSDLGDLENLWLHNNRLTTLPATVFSSLDSLGSLNLSFNELGTLPSGFFSSLGSLQSLNLSNNPGAPFVFAGSRLEPTGTSPRPGVVEVKLVVGETLPTMMTAALSAESGELSADEAVIPEGSSESAVFSVTQTAGAPVTLKASTGVLTDYVGVETAPSELVLDVVAPSVSGVAIVSIPASGDAYQAADGEVIRVEIGFDEAVEVSTTIAGPSLALTIGETPRAASYVPGLSEPSTLVFAYALQTGDVDADGISIEEDALVLAGAEITDLFGNPIESTSLGSYAVSNAAGHQVVERIFRVFFEPAEIRLVRGDAAMVVLKIEPALQGSEEAVVDLGDPRSLTGGLTVNPVRATLTPSSNEEDVTVAAGSTAALGKAELSATLDAAASSLGNSRVSTESLTVEVVLPAEAAFEPDSLMMTTTEGAAATVVVSLSRELSEDVTVAYRIEGYEADGYDPAEPADYSTPLGVVTVTVEAGATTAAIVIDIIDDEEIEPPREAFRVVLEAPPEGAAYVLASPEQTTAIVVINEGVCDRTPQIRDGIVELIGIVSDCADVTDDHLSGVGFTSPFLNSRGIATLKAGDFSGFDNLQVLNLFDNQLSTLPATVFSGLGNLNQLTLRGNQLSTLPATVFSGLDNLEWLRLGDNRLTILPSGVFSSLSTLTILVLGENQLSTLPADVFSDLGSLEWLFLNSNQLSTLPSGIFSGLGKLEWLDLQNNALTTLPSGVFSGLGNLEMLNLQNNALTTLPTGVLSDLGNLRFLGLNGNQLSTLPSGVFSGLGSLQSLDLRNNPGAPFVFAFPRLEPTGTSPGHGVVEIKLVVDEPLPTMMTADLSAEGGTLSDSQAVIPGGSTESAVFTVTQEAGAPVVTLASSGILTNYFGVETAASELILDVVAPSMSGVEIVSIPASGDAYQAADSEVIRVEVGFDEVVEASTTIAGPSLALTIGETARAASYIPDLSGATTLVFAYALQSGDVDVDGISIEEDALVLAGAEIADLFGNPLESTSLGSYAISDAAGHQVVEHIFRVFFEPAEIRLVRGGAAMVVLRIEPALQGSEKVVVDLGDFRSLTGGLSGSLTGGLTVNPARATLTPSSNEEDVTVAAGSTADLGKAELSATLDAGASVLGNSRVSTESLTVEVSLHEASFEPASLMMATTEGEAVTVVVLFSRELFEDVTVAYRIEGHGADGYDSAEPADYSTPLGMVAVTIEAGATTAAIVIDIIDDKEIEPPREAFRVVLEAPPEGAAYVLASPEQTTAIVVINEGVCDRTPQIRDGIVELISVVNDCAEVTDDDLSGVTGTLDFFRKSIATLKAGDFSGLDGLQVLDIFDNQLSTLPATVFSGLGSLEWLTLSSNQLSTLPAIVFSGLDNLDRLQLGNNRLTTLPADVFSGLGNLVVLSLNGNQLSDLPAGVFSDLGNLELLDLSSNQLSTLPVGIFSGFGNLELLDLSSNQLSTLPVDVFSGFDNLELLDLSSNQLSTLPVDVFSGFDNLESLDLRNNPGAPFVFAHTRLESTGTSPGPGVAEVKLVVDETWPTTMTAALSAEGGELSVEEAVIPEGSSESAVFSVTQIAGAPVSLRASTGVLTDYFGVETASSELILDVVGPSVSGVAIVSVPASGDAYQAADSEVIRVEVGFDEAVEVSTPTAGPSLVLTIGETTRAASYVPVLSGATTLVFAYVLQSGDVDIDGIGIGEGALVLAGAEIADLFGNPIESTSLGSYAISNAAGHQVVEHIFRVFFEPAEIRLVRGDAAMVVLKIEPELQDSEKVVVDLGDPRSLTGGLTGGLTVNPARATLTPSSNEEDITVAAESTADIGKATLSARLDVGASSLGNSRVSTGSLTIEVSLHEASFEPDSLIMTTTEGEAVTVVVSFSRELFEDVTVAYRIEGHGADGYDPAEPADYSTPLGVVAVTVEAGATTAAIVIDVIDDKEIEPPQEAFRVVLEAPPEGAAYVLASPEQTTAIVVINEGVCDRTEQVRGGIVSSIGGVGDCADVTGDDLSEVEFLGLGFAGIATLKAGDFSGFDNLQVLNLFDNQLSTLPATVFSGLGNLRQLTLRGNQLSTLPATVFSGLDNLGWLRLGDNRLTILPSGVFSSLSTLTILVLGENQLSTLPADVFSGLGSLEWLFLNSNQLSTLPSGIFSGLGKLEWLNLHNNALTTLPSDVFSGLGNLETLNLHNNALTTLPSGVLSDLGNLRFLGLNGNQLSTLPSDVFSGLGSLQSLDLSNNPGAPFVFAFPRLEPTGTSPGPDVVEVKLVVDETWPTTMTAALSAEGGELSVEEAVIPEGSSESAVFSVTQIAGAPVSLRASTGVLTDYFGVGTASSELVLDVVGPSVSGVAIVSIPASGDAYQAADSEVIRVEVGFDEAVEASTTVAGPSLALTIGETTRTATYVPGLSGATTLVFAYALQSGDADVDGISIEEDALVLAGAEITDLFGNPIESTSLGSHAVSNAAGHQVIEHVFRVFFEPAEIRLVRGGVAMVVLKIEPELQDSEEVVVDLGDFRSLTGGLSGSLTGGLTVNPARATLTPSSNEADVTVAAESTADLGKAELPATLDAGASVLGNSRVTTESLVVGVVRGVELSLSDHAGQAVEMVTIVAGESTEITVATVPVLEGNERVTVTLSVASGLTLEGVGSALIGGNALVLTSEADSTSATVRVGTSTPDLNLRVGVSASGVGENVEVVGEAPSLGVITEIADEVAVVLSSLPIAVQQGGSSTMLRVGTDPLLSVGQVATVRLTIAPDDVGLSFADGSFITDVKLGEIRRSVDVEVIASPDAAIGSSVRVTSMAVGTSVGLGVVIDGRSQATLGVTTPRVTLGLRPAGGEIGEALVLGLGEIKAVELSLTGFMLSGRQTAVFEVSVSGAGLSLQGGAPNLRVSLDAVSNMTMEVTVAASTDAVSVGELSVRALSGVELAGGVQAATLPVEVLQEVSLIFDPDLVLIRQGRSTGFEVRMSEPLIADRSVAVALVISAEGFSFADTGSMRHEVVLDADKAMETVTVATTADVDSIVPVPVSVDPTPGIDGLDVPPGLSLQVLPPPAVVMIGNESSMVPVREGATAMITVRAAPVPSEALTIGYVIGTDGDVATVDADGSDYADVTGGTVTIRAGEESATIEVRITDDKAIEAPREFFRVSLTTPSEYAAYVLASPDRTTAIVAIKEGVCDRTPQVRDGILAKAGGVSDCADVTGDDLSGVREVLDLSSMGIAVLRAGDFSGLGNLGQLWLHENELTALPADVFSGLGGLEVLYLSFNDQLTTLPATVFSDLGNLRELDLESNQLSALPATVFSGLGNLGWLNLGGNRLTALPAGVFSGLENLSTLVLSVNALSALPATVFSGLGNLESLDLRENPGAPFVFARPRLEQTSVLVPLALGVVVVKLVVDETWPTTMTAALSVEGGDLLVDEAVIPEGNSESAIFSVTQTAGAPVSLRASTGVLTGYFGVETAPSELVLDVIGPSVSGVEIISRPASGDAYSASSGEVIRVAVGFDEAVEVSTSTAGPWLTLTIWEATRAASYVPGLSEASTLVFAYALRAGDVDVDGISIEEDALVLAGAGITDVSARKNPIEDTGLGDHAIMDAGRHRIAERRLSLSLSLEPSSVTAGSFATATLTLGGELLAEDLSVRVSLTPSSIPGSGLSAPSEVTLKAGDASTRFRVSAALDATPGDSSLMASVDLSVQNSVRALVSSTTLEVTVNELPPVVVMVDDESSMMSVKEGETAMIIVRAAPAPLEALTIGYAIGTDGDDATADADGGDYADVTGGRVTIGAGEGSAVIEVRITDDAAIEAPREFFRVSLTTPPEDAAYVLASPEQATAIVVIKEGVCDRTPQVRDEILRQISGVGDCAEVTDDDLSGVSRILSLSSRDIVALKAGDFSGLGNLRELDLWRNQLSTLPAGIFSGLGNLTRLVLGENQLSTLPSGVFSGLGNLEYLSLWNNRLTALPEDGFSGLGSLEALWLLANPGVPFVFARPRLEPTGTLPGPGVVEVKLVVDETLPTTMTVALSVAGGELSAEEAVIPGGSSESAVFFVTQTASAPVSLRASTGVLTGSFFGVETAPSELTLDVIGPSVSGVEIVSRPASGDVYRASSGEIIRVAVGFDEAVEVSNPTAGLWLTLTIWKTARAASYMPDLSEATTLVFAYTLRAGDVDVDGISIEEDALVLAGAGITDVSARKNPIEDTGLGDHAIMNAGRHRIAERRLSLSLSLEPSSVAAGSFATATLTLGGAELLAEEPSVRVSLTPGSTPGPGLSAPSEVTLKAGDAGTRFRVSADLDAPPGDSSLMASVDLSVQNSIQALVSSTTLEVRIDRRLIGVVWEPDEITLMRGDSVQVKVTAVPALQATESIVLIPASQSADLSFSDSEGNDIGAVFSQGVLLDVSTLSSNVMTITVAGSAAATRTSVSLSRGTATALGDNVDLDLEAELAVTVSEPPPVVVMIGNESSVVSVEEGETAMITVRSTPVPLEALTIGYGIDADGDDATADADGNDYTDAAGGTVTIGPGEESATIEVRITDDEAIDAPREFFGVSLTAPPEDAAYVLASAGQTAAIVVIKEGVCDRTEQVRDGILRQISDVSDCADVTDADLSGVTGVLSLSSRDIAALNAGDFSGLGNLEWLDLSSNQLSTLPAGVFSGLGNLTRLVLEENQLSTLPAGVFSGLGNLERLDLSSNQLSTLPAGIFSDLGNLARLVIEENRLSALPVDVFSGLGNLERLALWRNQLSTLPANVFSGLGNLEVLWLFDNPGAPFVFARPRLEPTGTSPGPGVVEVKLVMDETLPTTMIAALSAEGGELSAEEAVIPEGSSESAVFSVTQTAGAPVVTSASSGGLTNYIGVETAPSELTLDVVGPSVSDVGIISRPASGDAYRASSGEVIRVAVVFDEAVEVSTPIAGPRLTLTIGETTRAAVYVPGLSEASTLVFAYELQIGDIDLDGISIEEDALVLAGAGITDVSARKNPIEDTSLGDHAIMDAGRHRIAERQLSLSLSLEPPSMEVGSFATATLTLEGAELLAEETSVRVSLTPGSGLSVPSSEVTLKAGDGGTRFRVSADLDAIPGDSSLRASVDLSVQTSIQALVSSTTLEVRIDRRLIGVIWEPDDVTLMRGGSVQVRVTAAPALRANESIVLIPASQSADLSFLDSEGNQIGVGSSQGVLLDVSTFSSNTMTIVAAEFAAATRTSVSLSRGAATVLDDNVYLDLRAELAVTVSAPPPAVVMIGNESSMVSVREGETALIIVRAAPVSSEALTIGYAIGTDGDAATADADGDDYADVAGAAVTGTVTIGVGEASTTIEVRITDDEAIEATREFFRVFLTAPSEDAAYALASPDRTAAIVVIKEGVCDRTPQVRDGILRLISGVSDCAEVTDDDLSGVTGVLDLSFMGIAVLRIGDFSGLVNLERLDLNGNPLTTLPTGIFVGLTLSDLILPPYVVLPLRFIPVDESGEPASAQVTVGLAQGAPFEVSVDLFAFNATLSTSSALIPQGATQSEVFTVWRENPGEVVIVGFAGGTSDAPPNSRVVFDISDVFVMNRIGRSVVWIPSNLLGGVVSAREGATAMITVRAVPTPLEALTIGYEIGTDGDVATADADGNDYADAAGAAVTGTVTIGAGEESATIEVRITDDEAIEATREFFRVFLTVPSEDAVYLLASLGQTAAIVVIEEGVCDRTAQVRDEILVKLSGVSDCADVTDEHLSGVSGGLDLSSMGIAVLRAGDFSGLGNLGQLWLHENVLTTLPADVFKGFGNLSTLVLSFNALTTLPVTVFSGLGSLETLFLNHNQLSALPATVFSGPDSLERLFLDNNQLSTLPEGMFSGLGNLEWLFLNNNQLTTLPESIFSGLDKLEDLSLRDNELTALPMDVFSGLGSLETLFLHSNQLTALPADVFKDLDNLELVYLNDNKLTALPEGLFSGLGNLRTLDLRENPGAPFVLARPRLEQTGTSPGPGVVEVKLVVDETLPTAIIAGLSAEGGTLSDSQAVVPGGSTESATFTVTQEAGAPVATLKASTGTLTGFLGAETAPSERVLSFIEGVRLRIRVFLEGALE